MKGKKIVAFFLFFRDIKMEVFIGNAREGIFIFGLFFIFFYFWKVLEKEIRSYN